MSIISFCKENSLNFVSCSIELNEDTQKKIYLPVESGYKDFDFKKSLDVLKAKGERDCFLIGLQKKFIVIDTDTPRATEFFEEEILEKLKIKPFKTESPSNVFFNKKGKFHYWFKNPFEDVKNILKWNKNDIDIITDIISEVKTTELDYNLMPELPETLYNVFYKFNEKKIENKSKGIYTEISKENLIKILDNLDISRWNNYEDWRNIGFIFINEKFDIDLFIEYSIKKYQKKITENEILKQIKTWGKKDSLKVASLFFMLKKDNFEVFKELQINRVDLLNLIDKFNPHDIAKIYYQNHLNDYIYNLETKKSGVWYEYDKFNKLILRETIPPSLVSSISNEIQELLEHIRINHKPPTDLEKMTEYKKVQTKILNCYNKVGSSKFCDDAIKFLQNLYLVDKIADKIDNNKNLWVFENKVYELGKGIRDISKNDYVSNSCGYFYNEKLNTKENEVFDFFSSIFGESELVNYQLEMIASCLFGNELQKFYIHKGSGANGKGILNYLNNKAFGNYTMEGSSDLFTQPDIKKINCLYDAKGKRFLTVSEPDNQNGNFNIKLLLKITGNDVLNVEKKYYNPIEYLPFFTPHLFTNDIPNLGKGGGNEIERRFEIINYPFEFKDEKDYDENNKNHRLKDYDIKNKFDESFIISYMVILFNKAELFIKNKKVLNKPQVVQEETANYLNENDPFKGFINDRIEITKNNNDMISSSVLLNEVNQFTNLRFTSSEIKRRMTLLKINCIRNNKGVFFNGVKFKFNNEDPEQI